MIVKKMNRQLIMSCYLSILISIVDKFGRYTMVIKQGKENKILQGFYCQVRKN